MILILIKRDPRLNLSTLRNQIEQKLHVKLSNATLSRFLTKHRWSWKIPTLVQLNKFSPKNKQAYAHYLASVLNIPVEKLKFMDESHVVERHLSKRKVLSMVNERRWISDRSLHGKSFTIMFLCLIIEGKECFFHINQEINTALNVFNFVQDAFASGYLAAGDFLIMDNAPIH